MQASSFTVSIKYQGIQHCPVSVIKSSTVLKEYVPPPPQFSRLIFTVCLLIYRTE
jgi:hypothetical protein